MFKDTIKVGTFHYSVIYPYLFQERTDLTGQADHDLCQIRISQADGSGNIRVDSKIRETFLHELIHIADVISGHEIFKGNEGAIEGISNILFSILDENDLIKF